MISIIAAIGKNRELGKDNKLLWHIPEDFKRFKDLTSGHVVIMGRKTYKSLPEKFRPLPNRINIVITKDINYKINGAVVCHSIKEAITSAVEEQRGKTAEVKEIFIIGGASIYEQGIKYADKLYLTLVDKEYPGADTFFPDYPEFGKAVFEKSGVEGELKYRFVELVKQYLV
ncbi:MAG: dihydrofolate reductase [Candidatus Roizmanbacteria bacterium]|nr:dihydrofolate reductase [Candidatus Roizmanbacteria bacterium]